MPKITINADRYNAIRVELTQSGSPHNLAGQTLHFSVFSQDREIFHVTQDTHCDATGGISYINITAANSTLLGDDGDYKFELSREDGSGYIHGIISREDSWIEIDRFIGTS